MGSIVIVGDFALISYKYAPMDAPFLVRVKGGSGRFNPAQQVFSYQVRNADGSPKGEMIHVAIRKLLRQLANDPPRYECKLYSVNEKQAQFIIKNNGIELEHLDRIANAETPGVVLRWDDGTETIVDGNHRYVKRWQQGKPDMWFVVVTEAQIRPCLLDFPDELAPLEAREAK